MSHYNRPEVPTERLREAFERSGLSKGEVASRMGWVRPNVDQLNRALGYRPDSNSRTPGVRERNREAMSYELAMRLASALDVDPVDLDL